MVFVTAEEDALKRLRYNITICFFKMILHDILPGAADFMRTGKSFLVFASVFVRAGRCVNEPVAGCRVVWWKTTGLCV